MSTVEVHDAILELFSPIDMWEGPSAAWLEARFIGFRPAVDETTGAAQVLVVADDDDRVTLTLLTLPGMATIETLSFSAPDGLMSARSEAALGAVVAAWGATC